MQVRELIKLLEALPQDLIVEIPAWNKRERGETLNCYTTEFNLAVSHNDVFLTLE